jgi:hypothetical protein
MQQLLVAKCCSGSNSTHSRCPRHVRSSPHSVRVVAIWVLRLCALGDLKMTAFKTWLFAAAAVLGVTTTTAATRVTLRESERWCPLDKYETRFRRSCYTAFQGGIKAPIHGG